MFFTGYPLSSLCLMAGLALLFAFLLRLADNRLRVLQAVPSLITGWNNLCARLVQKLNRQGRSDAALRSRSRVLVFTLFIFAALLGNIVILILQQFQNDYLETLLLALVFLALPKNLFPLSDDPAAMLRDHIESDGIRLLQRILAPLSGWVLLGWPGIFIMLTAVALRNSVTSIQGGFALPIERLSKILLFPAGFIGIGILAFAALFTSKGAPLPALRSGLEKMLAPHQAVIVTLAEALGLSLAGPSSRYVSLLGKEWLGSGIARLQPPDIKRWQWHLTLSQCLLIAMLILLSLLL